LFTEAMDEKNDQARFENEYGEKTLFHVPSPLTIENHPMNDCSIEDQLKNINLDNVLLHPAPSAAPNMDFGSGCMEDFSYNLNEKVVLPPRPQSCLTDSRPKMTNSERYDIPLTVVENPHFQDDKYYDQIKKSVISMNDFKYIQFKRIDVKAEVHEKLKNEVQVENLKENVETIAAQKDTEEVSHSLKENPNNESTAHDEKIDTIHANLEKIEQIESINLEADEKDLNQELEPIAEINNFLEDPKKFSAFKRFKKYVLNLMICGFKNKT
jgi:hypothetical protein